MSNVARCEQQKIYERTRLPIGNCPWLRLRRSQKFAVYIVSIRWVLRGKVKLDRMRFFMTQGFIQRGGLWVLAQSVFMGAIGILGMTNRNGLDNRSLFLVGMVFLVVAAICGWAGIVALGRNLTPFPRPSATAPFVKHGIYALIRHPLYTAVFCAAVGWSLIWQSVPASAVSLGLGVFFDAKARREECWLRDQFPEYAAYERRVRRFIPWIY